MYFVLFVEYKRFKLWSYGRLPFFLFPVMVASTLTSSYSFHLDLYISLGSHISSFSSPMARGWLEVGAFIESWVLVLFEIWWYVWNTSSFFCWFVLWFLGLVYLVVCCFFFFVLGSFVLFWFGFYFGFGFFWYVCVCWVFLVFFVCWFWGFFTDSNKFMIAFISKYFCIILSTNELTYPCDSEKLAGQAYDLLK